MHIVDNFDTLNPYIATQTVSRETKHLDLLYALQTFHMKQLHTKLSLKHCFMWNKNLSKIKKDFSPCFTWNLCSKLLQTFHVKHHSHYPQIPLPVFQNYQTATNRCFMWNIFPIIRPSWKSDPREIKMIGDKILQMIKQTVFHMKHWSNDS